MELSPIRQYTHDVTTLFARVFHGAEDLFSSPQNALEFQNFGSLF